MYFQMLEFRKDMRKTANRHGVRPQSASSGQAGTSASARAAQAQNSGFARVNALMRQLSAESSTSPSSAALNSGLAGSAADPTTDSAAEREAREREEDEHIVDAELRRYIDEGPTEESNNFDLLKYWEVRLAGNPMIFGGMLTVTQQLHEDTFPTLFCIALDVLPVQASAVPSERVFSASKETDTDRRSNIEVELMEMLQVLKYAFREDWLCFTQGWVAPQPRTDPDSPIQDKLMALANPNFTVAEPEPDEAMFDQLQAEGNYPALYRLVQRDMVASNMHR